MRESIESRLKFILIFQFSWLDAADRDKLLNAVIDDVIKEVHESSGLDTYSTEDVRVSLRKVLFRRIGIEPVRN